MSIAGEYATHCNNGTYSSEGSVSKYYCCTAEFGDHETTCENYPPYAEAKLARYEAALREIGGDDVLVGYIANEIASEALGVNNWLHEED